LAEPRIVNVKHSAYNGARRLGEEFCEVTATVPQRQRVACVVESGDEVSQRVCNGFKDKLLDYCPEKQHIFQPDITLPLSATADQIRSYIGTAVTVDASITALVTPNDHIASIADEAVELYASRQIRISGFGHTSMGRRLLSKYPGGIYATIDTLYFKPGRGLMFTLQRVIALMATDIDSLPAGMSDRLYSDSQLIVEDMASETMNTLLRTYDKRVRPPGAIVGVSVALRSVSIVDFKAEDGVMDVVVQLERRWQDLRLTWEPAAYEGVVRIADDEIWQPLYYFTNLLHTDTKDLYRSPATINATGHVVQNIRQRGVFMCYDIDMTMFPFDSQPCDIRLRAVQRTTLFSLDPVSPLEVVDAPEENFEWYYKSSSGTEESDGDEYTYVSWDFCFDRLVIQYHLALIIPGILLNLIGFIAFWIPEPGDSITLGITTLLCALALRTSIETPNMSMISWLEVFILVTICFQGVVVLFSFVDYSGKLNKICTMTAENTVDKVTDAGAHCADAMLPGAPATQPRQELSQTMAKPIPPAAHDAHYVPRPPPYLTGQQLEFEQAAQAQQCTMTRPRERPRAAGDLVAGGTYAPSRAVPPRTAKLNGVHPLWPVADESSQGGSCRLVYANNCSLPQTTDRPRRLPPIGPSTAPGSPPPSPPMRQTTLMRADDDDGEGRDAYDIGGPFSMPEPTVDSPGTTDSGADRFGRYFIIPAYLAILAVMLINPLSFFTDKDGYYDGACRRNGYIMGESD